jgi:hypothetical protein
MQTEVSRANLRKSRRLLRMAKSTAACADWVVGDAGIEPATPPV